VNHLLQDEKAVDTLSSRQHVTVTLELLGQAFGLDVSDEKIISQVTELYRRWLLTDAKPTPFRNDVEHYIVVRKTRSSSTILRYTWYNM
jgi:hypothetical protein